MGPAPRASVACARAVPVVVVALLLAGCGGSLADADRPAAGRARPSPPGDFCAAVLAGAEAARPLAALVDRGGAVSRAQLGEAADRIRSANAEVLVTAPAEIRADVERSVAAADLQLDALVAAGGDTAAAAQDAGGPAAQEYAAATRRVRDYIVSHCGATRPSR